MPGRNELTDDVRVECGAGPSYASYRFNEFGNVQNAVFEQVADAATSVGKQLGGVGLLDILSFR
jgi:hypothetical protein